MSHKTPFAMALIFASLSFGTAFAQDRGEHGGGEQHHEGAPPPQQHQAPPPPEQRQINHGPVRAQPPAFQGHAPGQHPQGAQFHSHPVRVLAPRVIVHGRGGGWNHWDHPDFARPNYYWNWHRIHSVSCVAEDSYGDQYPVTEAWGRGWGLDNMTSVEDQALDRCYSESGQDGSCYLATCSHF